MAQIPTEKWEDDYDELTKYAIIAVSVFGGVLLLILCLVLGLCIWNCILCSRVRKANSLTFKLSRPKLISKKDPAPKPPQFVTPKPTTYNNPGFTQDLGNPPNRQYSTDNNPIAIRSKTSFDNGNFSFGSSPDAFYADSSHRSPGRSLEPEYNMKRDSKFY